ncbi:RNA-dependent RNA polymerase, partial [Scheffersomyces segobiensis virus L]
IPVFGFFVGCESSGSTTCPFTIIVYGHPWVAAHRNIERRGWCSGRRLGECRMSGLNYHNPVPLYVDENMAGTVPEKSRYVLVHVSNDDVPVHNIDYPMLIPYCGEYTIGKRIKRRNIVCWYAKLDFISIYTPKLMSIVGGYISGNIRSGMTVENHRDFYMEFDKVIFNKVTSDEIRELNEYVRSLDVTKITGDHHLFVNRQEVDTLLEEAMNLGKYNDRLAALMVLKDVASRIGIDNRVSFITHLVYILIAPPHAFVHLLSLIGESTDAEDYASILKRESGAAKQLQTVFRSDLASLYELNVLVNRVDSVVDWNKEIDHRTNVKAVGISTEDVYKISTEIFKDAVREGRYPQRLEWQDYWVQRWSAMPNGSVISQYDEDIAIKKLLPFSARVKSAWFAAKTESNYDYWLKRTPQIYASTSTKYEWGKVRALYGCDVTSFLHSDFGMTNCEDILPSYFPVGRKANEKYVRESIEKFRETVPVCFDYDDFNSQHSTSSMRTVLQAWLDVNQKYLTEEQVNSVEWTRDSLDSILARFNSSGDTISLSGTLMSGWRLTSFMNTVLNRVYLVKANLFKHLVYALHNGDDMFGGAVNMAKAVAIIRDAKAIGVRAQVSKTNLGTIGEFLRVDTRAIDPTNAQYLSRSVATLVHGRVESSAPNDLRELVSAIITRSEEVISRGGDFRLINKLTQKTLDFAARLFNVDNTIIDTMLSNHPVQGGMNKDAPVHLWRIERRTEPFERETLLARYSLIAPGLFNYVDRVKEQFGVSENLIDKEELLYRAGVSLEKSRVYYELVIETTLGMDIYRALHGVWKSPGYVAPIAKIRSLGLIPAKELRNLNSVPAHLIRTARNPILMMGTIF